MSEDRKPYLYDLHVELGAKIVPFGGWAMPLQYEGGTVAEHLACRNDAVVFDVSHLGTVRVTGPEAFDQLQVALTNDLRKRKGQSLVRTKRVTHLQRAMALLGYRFAN